MVSAAVPYHAWQPTPLHGRQLVQLEEVIEDHVVVALWHVVLQSWRRAMARGRREPQNVEGTQGKALEGSLGAGEAAAVEGAVEAQPSDWTLACWLAMTSYHNAFSGRQAALVRVCHRPSPLAPAALLPGRTAQSGDHQGRTH